MSLKKKLWLIVCAMVPENKQEEAVSLIVPAAPLSIPATGNVHVIAKLLVNNGITATFYHAGLNNDVKDQRQKSWLTGESRTMVATNAFEWVSTNQMYIYRYPHRYA